MSLPVVTERCSGHCCRAFTLSCSPEELAQLNPHPEDAQVPGMVVYLQHSVDSPIVATRRSDDLPRHWYTCKNHDAETGDCKIYDSRPRMCRDYPYGKPCQYSDCTQKES